MSTMNMQKSIEKMVLRYATIASQEMKSSSDVEEMRMIENQLHLVPDAIMKKATELALSKVG